MHAEIELREVSRRYAPARGGGESASATRPHAMGSQQRVERSSPRKRHPVRVGVRTSRSQISTSASRNGSSGLRAPAPRRRPGRDPTTPRRSAVSSSRSNARASRRARSSASSTVSAPTSRCRPGRRDPGAEAERVARARKPLAEHALEVGDGVPEALLEEPGACRISSTTRGAQRISSVCQSSRDLLASSPRTRSRSEGGVARRRDARGARPPAGAPRDGPARRPRSGGREHGADGSFDPPPRAPLPRYRLASCAKASASDSAEYVLAVLRRRRIRGAARDVASWKNSATRAAPHPEHRPRAATASPSACASRRRAQSRARALCAPGSSSSWPSCSTRTRPRRSPSRATLARSALRPTFPA